MSFSFGNRRNRNYVFQGGGLTTAWINGLKRILSRCWLLLLHCSFISQHHQGTYSNDALFNYVVPPQRVWQTQKLNWWPIPKPQIAWRGFFLLAGNKVPAYTCNLFPISHFLFSSDVSMRPALFLPDLCVLQIVSTSLRWTTWWWSAMITGTNEGVTFSTHFYTIQRIQQDPS